MAVEGRDQAEFERRYSASQDAPTTAGAPLFDAARRRDRFVKRGGRPTKEEPA